MTQICKSSFKVIFRLVLPFHQMTSLHVAAEKGECIGIVKCLIVKGADINIKGDNEVSTIVMSIYTWSGYKYPMQRLVGQILNLHTIPPQSMEVLVDEDMMNCISLLNSFYNQSDSPSQSTQYMHES